MTVEFNPNTHEFISVRLPLLFRARVVQVRKAMPSPSTAADGSFLRPLGRCRGNASPGAAGIFPLKPGKMP